MTELLRLSHGLHRPSESVRQLTDLAGAYLDALPPGTVVGGITAARLHGMWLPSQQPSERVELVITRPGLAARALAGSRRGEILVRRRALSSDEIVVTDRFAMTSVARTWVDLAQTLSLEDLVAAADGAVRSLTGRAALVDAVRRARRRRGVLRARRALELIDERSRSRPESHLRCALVLGGLPAPELNQPIFTEFGEWLAEPDLIYRDARLALEYNGRDHADLGRMRRDITRVLDVDSHDWKVVVFGPREVFSHPHRIAPYVRSLLDRRDPGWWRRR